MRNNLRWRTWEVIVLSFQGGSYSPTRRNERVGWPGRSRRKNFGSGSTRQPEHPSAALPRADHYPTQLSLENSGLPPVTTYSAGPSQSSQATSNRSENTGPHYLLQNDLQFQIVGNFLSARRANTHLCQTL